MKIALHRNVHSAVGVTIFSIPKPFVDQTGLIQRNAVQSWSRLVPRPEIILCGDDAGVFELTQELELRHLASVTCNPQGTPLLSDVFSRVHQLASHPILVYVNADIIFLPDFIPIVQQVAECYPAFLMLGRRWNLTIDTLINFDCLDWDKLLLNQVNQTGVFAGIGALDYFVFPKPLFTSLPAFAVGRAGWDSWMVGEALKQGYPIINASQVITAIHQNHDYSHLPGQRLEAFHGLEARQNRSFLKGYVAGSSANATVYLTDSSGAATPRFSLIVAVESQAAIDQVIAMLRLQSNSDFEVILVGDRLIDGSVVQSNGLSPDPIPTIRYYSVQDTETTVSAWNVGLQQAQGELVLFLDSNARLLPTALTSLLDCFESRNGSVEMVFSGWQWETNTTLTEVEPWTRLAPLLAGREGVQGFHVWMLPTLWEQLPIGSVLFRREWLQRLGGLNPHFRPQAALLDQVLYLFSRGAAAVYLEQSVLCYRSPYPYTMERVRQIDQEVHQLLDNFFAHPYLPPWVQALRCRAFYNVEVWLAWLMNEVGNAEAMADCLKQALSWSNETVFDNLFDWMNQFEAFSEAAGRSFDHSLLPLLTQIGAQQQFTTSSRNRLS